MRDPRIAEATEIVSRLWHSFPEEAVQPIACALAAAEERGRRRGVEERDNALKAAHDYCLYMFKRQWLTDERNRSIFAAHIFAILDAALAPRDSAPTCWKCEAPYRDAGACGYCQAPRDSGKVEP